MLYIARVSRNSPIQRTLITRFNVPLHAVRARFFKKSRKPGIRFGPAAKRADFERGGSFRPLDSVVGSCIMRDREGAGFRSVGLPRQREPGHGRNWNGDPVGKSIRKQNWHEARGRGGRSRGWGRCAQSRKFMHFDGGILVNGGKRRVSRRCT